MNIQHYARPALLAGALMLLPMAAMAQQQINANLNVSINILATCTLNATPLAFADQNALAISEVDATASVTVNCTATAPYTLGFGPGNNNTGGRRMADGSNNFINYEIYRDSARSEVLTALGGAFTIGGQGDGNDQALSVYGRVPTQTATASGAYTESPRVS